MQQIMKFTLLLFIVIGIIPYAYSQRDLGNQSLSISPINSVVKPIKKHLPENRFPIMNFPSITPPSSHFSSNGSSKYQIGQTNNVDFMKKEDFQNPGDIYLEKLNKKEEREVGQVFRKNQYLGDFRTKSTSAHIIYRDHEYVDGDRIRIYINDVLVQSDIVLDEYFQNLKVTLKSGFNKIDFEAINQGTSGPNTAEFLVYDEKEVLISANRWNLATGFKATIIIVKE